jgi:hypothetical protein
MGIGGVENHRFGKAQAKNSFWESGSTVHRGSKGVGPMQWAV